jgi:type I restriction enzyme S subunit
MIADLKPYAKYKESGLPWIGTMPAHWDARRLRHACEMRVSNVDKHTKKGEIPVRLCNYVDAYKNERIKESLRFMLASATKDELARFRLHKLDVVITKDSEDWKDIGVPSLVEYEAQDLVCGYHLAILRPRLALNGAFLHRALQCHFIAVQLRIEANGVTRYGLSHGAILGVSIPLPSLEEQTAIVRFLDWANGRLERAIRAKRKVIALLNEQKQAIIHRAVTRGLDPSVPLKPSGIPWLGDIPQHWQAKRLKAIALIRYGLGQPPRESETGLPLIRATNVDSGRILEKNLIRVDPADVPKTRNAFLKAGEIIVVRSGALTADSAIIPKEYEGAVAGYDMVVSVIRAQPEFVAMALLSNYVRRDQLIIASMRAAQPHLNAEELGSAIIILPPDDEQNQIMRFVLKTNLPLESAISRLEREIDLLREYRTRLVADVVTGKLDVREAAAKLPVEEQVEPMELESNAQELEDEESIEEAEVEA